MTGQKASSQGSSIASDSVTIVNINATSKDPVVKFFKAGTYEVSVIGTSEGGGYDAWSRWSEEFGPLWLNAYTIDSPQFEKINIGKNDQIYNDKTEALAAAKTRGSVTFTLNSDGEVNFSLEDDNYTDNRDGMSLAVKKKDQRKDDEQPTPKPSEIAPPTAGVSFIILVIVTLFSIVVWVLANLIK
ncbi:hypothetical protein [Allocoleopsis sp.]|uniref:hypothetical protein n=1 Tax=Allocoleopsis sp. TaxID=3088169 RepID=UPI002FD5E5AA